MEIRWFLFGALAALCCSTGSANKLPVFTADMNNVALSENTPVGEVVYQLQGVDPDGMPITYGLIGTHKFTVDKDTGEVTLAKPLDREVEDTIKFLVYIEDRQDPSLVQRQPVTVIVLDENDNPPTFKNSPYEVDVPEDEKVGTTILRNIEVLDKDSVGDNLEVGCIAKEQWPEACDTFEVVTISSTANQYAGALVLKKPLNYNEQQFYQFQLYATDGTLNSTAHVEVKVGDVQNSPPVFSGSLTAALSEDAPVGTLVLTIKARDADRANPRPVVLELVTDPFDFFVLDSNTGELKTAKPLDREALEDPSSPLNVTVRASELVNGVPLTSDLTSSLATVTVTIKDVNDEAPRFNKREYYVEIPESLPPGTPLPNLDMVVTDRDVGLNSVFSLRLSDDMEAFIVEPAMATGTAAVTLRLNAPLDYEDPNQRKFILEVIAEEVHTKPPLSSKASVTITLTDVNDNAPQFDDEPYSASVAEAAPPGTIVAQYTPADRDTGSFGTEGIVYELSGSGAQLFDIDERSGLITVADCGAPGRAPCLDYETRKEYLLQLKATDDDGKGQMSVVSLQMSLTDSNDNPPVFPTPVYRASIDEDAAKFEPELQVQARDPDVTSELRYSIVDPADQPFTIDPLTGKISVRLNAAGVSNDNGNKIVLTVLATDEVHNATCKVEITVRDVNNHAPAFDQDKYDADIAEDAPIGTAVAAVRATDLDSGVNSEIKYFIQKGAQDAFVIDNGTGIVTVASRLDFDKRDTYRVQIIASDLGLPSLTGTTELSIHVINVNDKKPYFTPAVQRAEVSADAEIGTFVHQLVADDPDIMDRIMLNYEVNSLKPVGAVDDNGKDVSELGIFSSWFNVFPNGSVVVSQLLDRTNAAVISLPVLVTDTSAPVLQQTEGELIITIVDVNRNAPALGQPSYLERMVEEQPVGTLLNTYTARDKETPISAIVIYPPSPYFDIDNVTGIVRTTHRIDYESTHSINFTLIAYDSGVPVRSGTAMVTVEVVNANDEEPKFAATEYDATVVEGANVGSRVVTVNAVDKDEGEFGIVTYSLTDSSAFTIDPQSGVITVARDDIDREKTTDFWMKAVATDAGNRSTSVPIHIKVLDVNDNPPVFTQKVYKSTIAENLQLNPPAAILQVLAEDKDEGANGKVEYSIEEQTEPGAFTVDASTGILYPARQVAGGTTHVLAVRARDAGAGAAGAGAAAAGAAGAGAGAGGARQDTAAVHIHVLSVNKHAPVFVAPPSELKQLEIPENAAEADFLITTIKATDGDSGENGRVSYFLKVDNQNVGETNEFSLDKNSGELRTKTFLDRELKAEYQLVIVAADNGTPSNFETLRLLTVVLIDENDNVPIFEHAVYNFMLKENLPAGVIVGTVRATDKDSGENSKVYYHLLEGNEEGGFTLDRTQGVIRANVSFDREKESEFSLTIYASNSPLLDRAAAILNSVENNTEGQENSITTVKVKILDENDNEPKFAEKIYYAGVKYTARVNEPILPVVAEDPDLGENGTLIYMVAASNLFKFGASKSSGSVVPSPFNITQDGILMTASYMSEYHQDRFVLDVIAQEVAPPHRQATAQVYVWIIDRSSMIRMVLSRGCGAGAGPGAGGAGGAEGAAKKLAAAAGATLVPAATRPLHADRWCEVHMHAVSPTTWAVLPAERVLADIDARYDDLSHVYAQYGVETLTAAAANRAPESFDPALAALTALLIVLFTGIVTFIVVCACLKHWVIPPPSLQSSKGDSLARRRILEELSTTENPLWLETKLRPYEEQELTMNVFGDQAEQLANVEQGQQTDNTYATIAGRTDRFGDYATLGGDSPTELEAALGFQGSTFKPPTPDTPEPPPRPSGLGVP